MKRILKVFNYKKFKPGKKAGNWDPFEYPGRSKTLWYGANIKITNWNMATVFVKALTAKVVEFFNTAISQKYLKHYRK